ncbi:unnamed protein product, partial [Aureobasidium pullulans]
SDSLSLLGQISDYQPQRSHHKIKMLKVTDTTEWIIKDRESFVSWLTRISTTEQPNQNCLWISGIIGCGKTFLVFLWARLQIDVLWDTCSTDEAIDRALLDLPKDLDETYERCLKRLQKKQEPYALRVIGYVYEARSPLTVEALGEALATNPTTGILLHKQIPPYRFIVECGANLIVFDSESQHSKTFTAVGEEASVGFWKQQRAGAMEAIYGHQAWWGEDVFTLLDALGVNQIDSDLVDHVLWRITSFIEHSHSKVLAWVVKQGDVNLLASAIKAGVSPDTRISSKDLGTGGNLVGDREEIVCEAIFFALEASSPDLALAFIRNGANRKVYTIQNQEPCFKS